VLFAWLFSLSRIDKAISLARRPPNDSPTRYTDRLLLLYTAFEEAPLVKENI
jgi:hypothetical protein